MRSTIFAAATFAAVASAQGKQHIVTVSAFQYTPPTVTADAGDVVTFVFSGTPGAHSVTQSTFANPCSPLANGFDSGFVTVAAGAKGPFEEFNVTVTGTTPIWFYCGQVNPAPHCLMGMVGAINAPSSGNTYDKFKATAQSLASLPNQGSDSHSAAILGGVNASATAAPASDPAATATAPANSSPIPPSGTVVPSGGSSGGSSNSSASSNGTAGAPAQTSKPASAFANSPFTGIYAVIAAAFLGVAL